MSIVVHTVLPIAILLGIGAGLQRAFRLDVRTLSKLIFYLFFPTVLFVTAYESELTWDTAGTIALFLVAYYAILYGTTELYAAWRRLEPRRRGTMRNSVVLDNNANYGIPLNQLVFSHDALALSVQLVVMTVQTLLVNSFGVYNVASRFDRAAFWRKIAGLPSVYALAIGFACNAFELDVPGAIYAPIAFVADAFLAFALVTLGIQLGSIRWSFGGADAVAALALKLAFAPAVGIGLLLAFGIEGMTASALLLSCTVPSSLAGVLLAIEFDSDVEFASQTAFASTLLSIVTVSLWIAVVDGTAL